MYRYLTPFMNTASLPCRRSYGFVIPRVGTCDEPLKTFAWQAIEHRWKNYISKSKKLKPKTLLEKFEILVREALTEKSNGRFSSKTGPTQFYNRG